MKKTKFSSYCINGITEGCKYCVKGRKLVLFITGKCSRNCFYCSLSSKRKNKDIIFANERECKSIKEAIEEARESNSLGVGITGGDPLICIERTSRYARALKKEFGSKFHIHIYLPTKLANGKNLKLISKFADEIRFHPSFLNEKKENADRSIEEDIEKIRLANLFFKKKNIGCEFPIISDRKNEIFQFIKRASPLLGFVNLNEFEISETNFDYVTENYKLNQDTYTIAGSKRAGLGILRECEKEKIKIKVHVCTAETKNQHQYKNRLKLHNILPYGYKTKEGSVRYFAIYCKNAGNLQEAYNKLKELKEIYADRKKCRIIISEKIIHKLLESKYKIARVEEFPTHDRTIIQLEYVK